MLLLLPLLPLLLCGCLCFRGLQVKTLSAFSRSQLKFIVKSGQWGESLSTGSSYLEGLSNRRATLSPQLRLILQHLTVAPSAFVGECVHYAKLHFEYWIDVAAAATTATAAAAAANLTLPALPCHAPFMAIRQAPPLFACLGNRIRLLHFFNWIFAVPWSSSSSWLPTPFRRSFALRLAPFHLIFWWRKQIRRTTWQFSEFVELSRHHFHISQSHFSVGLLVLALCPRFLLQL